MYRKAPNFLVAKGEEAMEYALDIMQEVFIPEMTFSAVEYKKL